MEVLTSWILKGILCAKNAEGWKERGGILVVIVKPLRSDEEVGAFGNKFVLLGTGARCKNQTVARAFTFRKEPHPKRLDRKDWGIGVWYWTLLSPSDRQQWNEWGQAAGMSGFQFYITAFASTHYNDRKYGTFVYRDAG